jgi:hypothetical protein
VERYLAHLDRLSGGVEPLFQPIESTKPGLKRIAVMIYKDLPEPGYITGFTYGLSLGDHPDWRLGRPELCISVRSDKIDWPWPWDGWQRACAGSARSATATRSVSAGP